MSRSRKKSRAYAAPHAGRSSPRKIRIFPSAATTARPSTWGNGPAAYTGFPLRCSIPSCWKRLKGCGLARPAMSDAGGEAEKTAWAWAVGTFLGAGLLRPGPGTWGSAAAALLWLAAGMGLPLPPRHWRGLRWLRRWSPSPSGFPPPPSWSGRADGRIPDTW